MVLRRCLDVVDDRHCRRCGRVNYWDFNFKIKSKNLDNVSVFF